MRKLAALIIGGAFVTAGLYGGTIISDLSAGPLSSAVDFSPPAQVGTQFTMGSTSFDNVSFTLGLLAVGARSLGPVDVTVWIYGGDTSSPSGSALLTIAPTGNFNGSLNTYVYTAPVDFTLDANTTYWIVAQSVQNQEGWVTFSNFQPTGPFATAPMGYNRSSSGLPTSIFSSTDTVAYQVDGTAVVAASGVPEPSTFGLVSIAALLIGCCRFAPWRGAAKDSR
jgi:hypothetical protein